MKIGEKYLIGETVISVIEITTNPWNHEEYVSTTSWDTKTKLLYTEEFVKDNFSRLYISQILL